MLIAVVTQSPQTTLIRNLLQLCLGSLAQHVLLRCNDNTWERPSDIPSNCKLAHVVSVWMQAIGSTCNPAQVLLIDDEPVQTTSIEQIGGHAVIYNRNDTDTDFVERLYNKFRDNRRSQAHVFTTPVSCRTRSVD